MALENRAHFRELAEDEGPVAYRQDLLQHFHQAGQLPRPPGDGGVIAEELRRVVANLLELR